MSGIAPARPEHRDDGVERAAGFSASVVICCFTEQRWDQLVEAVASTRRQVPPPLETIVVVDHCPSLLRRVKAEIDGVRVVANGGTQGLSGARNTGVAAARGDVVVFLDDDAAAADIEWFGELLTPYADPGVVAVGGRIEASWETARPPWFPREFDWIVGCSYLGLPEDAAPVRNVIGASMSFRTTVLRDLGGFKSELGRVGSRPMGCEETELCIRAGQLPGSRVVYQPTSVVRHVVPAERGTWRYYRARCFAEGLSKAAVAGLTGADVALQSERDYVRRALPRGLARAALGTLHHDAGAARRGGALIAGLLITAFGYVVGTAGRCRAEVAAVVVPLVALALWVVSLRHVDLAAMNDIGLVSVLPIEFWLAMSAVCVSFAVHNHRRASGRLLGLHVLAVVAMVHATPTILYGSLRYSWAWKHVGIVDYIVRHGSVDPGIAQLPIYHAWPGFFTLNALITRTTGLHSALSYAAWAPPVVEAALVGPLLLIFGALVEDRRRVWLAVMLFYLTNWVGQDYFSPQAMCFVLDLAVIAVCLRLLPAKRTGGGRLWSRASSTTQLDGPGRLAVLAIVAALMAVIASSHQLTPFMVVGALVVLVAAGRIRPVWLPALMAALTIGWILWLGRTFLDQNLHSIVASFGTPAANTQTTFVRLHRASLGQQVTDWADRAFTAVFWGTAALGWLRLRVGGVRENVPALLALTPVPFLVANDYGGEMLFRVFLFAVPFLVLLTTGLVYAPGRPLLPIRHPRARLWTRAAAGFVAYLMLAGGFALAYYGKERQNYFTNDERSMSYWLYRTAPRGSLIGSVNSNYPWAFEGYERYDYEFLEYLSPADRKTLPTDPRPVLRRFLATRCGHDAYLVLTGSEDLSERYSGGFDSSTLTTIATAMRSDPLFRTVYAGPDTTVFRRDATPCGGATP